MIERDWKSDPTTGELVFEDGDVVMVGDAPGSPDSIRQDVEERLRLVRGEWFLSDPESESPDDGIPLFERVLVKSPRLPLIASIYRAAILATPGVNDVVSIDLKLNAATRTLRIDWKASTDLGLIGSSIAVAVGG